MVIFPFLSVDVWARFHQEPLPSLCGYPGGCFMWKRRDSCLALSLYFPVFTLTCSLIFPQGD